MPSKRPVSKRNTTKRVTRSGSFDPDVAKACGIVLRQWRLKRDIAQDAFSLIANIDRSYYGKLERGERQPSLLVLLKCAGGFESPASVLVAAIEDELRRLTAPIVETP